MTCFRPVVALVAALSLLPTSVQAATGWTTSLASSSAAASSVVEPAAEDPVEKAKTLYEEAEKLAESGQWAPAAAKYEEAYGLVPDKHGFAYKVANAAYQAGDCVKAKQFFSHFIEKAGDQAKLKDKVGDAKKGLKQIEESKCAEPKPAAVPVEDVGGENPLDEENPLASSRSQREEMNSRLDRVGTRSSRQKFGLWLTIGGGVLLVAGAFGLGMALRTRSNLKATTEPGPTTFPTGDYACRNVPASECPYTLERNLKWWQVGGYSGLILGGAAVATGLTIFFLEKRKQNKAMASRWQVTPTFAPGYLGAAGGMKF